MRNYKNSICPNDARKDFRTGNVMKCFQNPGDHEGQMRNYNEEKKMAFEKAKEYLKQFGLENKVMEFDTSSATVELAAEAVGCEPARIAKTLSFKIEDSCILIVAAGDARIDNKKYKAQFHTKAKMLAFEEVGELTGHAVGGVCPFGVKDGVKVYLDESLKRFEIVYPACGSSNSAVELTLPELERASGCEAWIDVCK